MKAQTKVDYGPPISCNVTTGPQEGSPSTPKELNIEKTLSSIELRWLNGATGKGPILGYYIESLRKGTETFYNRTNITKCVFFHYFVIFSQEVLYTQ